MEKLKMGDTVEICDTKYNHLEENWKSYIFVKMGYANSIIFVLPEDEENYKNGLCFNVMKTNIVHKWRIPEEPKYRPFTFEDRELFKDKWLMKKNNKAEAEYKIIAIYSHYVLIEETAHSYVDLFNYFIFYFIFTDGSPCGVEVK